MLYNISNVGLDYFTWKMWKWKVELCVMVTFWRLFYDDWSKWVSGLVPGKYELGQTMDKLESGFIRENFRHCSLSLYNHGFWLEEFRAEVGLYRNTWWPQCGRYVYDYTYTGWQFQNPVKHPSSQSWVQGNGGIAYGGCRWHFDSLN